MGLERNLPCSCGSGKKYKTCCMLKENKVQDYKVQNDLNKYLNFKKCHAPEFMIKEDKCQKIIKAHTISKSNNLKPISKDGHVYEFKKDYVSWKHNNKHIEINKIGINEASTFFGFCSFHDTKLFMSFENNQFYFEDEQIFLISYRAIVRELYIKKLTLKFYVEKLTKEYSKRVELDEKSKALIKGTELGLNDISSIKEIYDSKIQSRRFSNIKYYAIIIDSIPEVMASSAWTPEFDFNDNLLCNLMDESRVFHGICINTFAYNDNHGVILFSWDEDEEINENYQFIKSLHNISNINKPKAILKLLFTNIENIYFAPQWWDNLSAKAQDKLKYRFNDAWNTSSKFSDYEEFYFVNWNIVDIKTNIEAYIP